MRLQTTAAEMATTAPTEISMPAVAMTKVMPRARITNEQLRFKISIRRPYSLPSSVSCMVKNPSTNRALKVSSTKSATTGKNSELSLKAFSFSFMPTHLLQWHA